jgi:CheY-like chemotaxis protein
MMPVMDGRAFRAEQQKDPLLSSIPVIVFSAHGHLEATPAALRADGHLKKPLRSDAILASVGGWTKSGHGATND